MKAGNTVERGMEVAEEDETDRAPRRPHVSRLDAFLLGAAVVVHLVDVGLDLNVAIQYHIRGQIVPFWATLAFLLIPAFINTAVSLNMYAQDKEKLDSLSKKITKGMIFRVMVLVFQMAPILRYIDALRYALKSRRAEKDGDLIAQRKWYRLMLREDSDAALLRAFECFLEAAPQQVLQLSLMIDGQDEFKIHQILSVVSSTISMGWCLAGYQRAIRFAQEDKDNISWLGSCVQILWHFLISISRIMSVAVIAYLFPYWTVLACVSHALIMSAWLQFYEKSPFCSDILYGYAFSLVMGFVYIFTYIMPVEGRTRYRYAIFYLVCFVEDIACTIIWILYANDSIRTSDIFYPIIAVAILPYILGIVCMIIYYQCLHSKKRKGNHDSIKITDHTVPNIEYNDS